MKSPKLKSKYISKDENSRLYNIPCPIIGLTGGIATGKSTVTQMLKDLGHHVICADQLVKDVYKLDSTTDHIRNNFPNVMINGAIDFKKLRELVFSQNAVKEDIENLIYAQMPNMFKLHFSRLENPGFIFYDVPLLFEKKLDQLVDLKILVYCPREIQIKRLVARDGSSKELAEKIINSQIDIEAKKSLCDLVIDNSKDKEDIVIPNYLWE